MLGVSVNVGFAKLKSAPNNSLLEDGCGNWLAVFNVFLIEISSAANTG